ncbi:stage VI sporulation protein D [Peribacillus saganii]|uniref:stage VI sporulation protein D n=1 Tax=Peribacillus saganii TaxID=2303992 RepID=UPI00115F3CFD|nr:stage VI sporulation protein D [Peribacillus saganii]
MSKENQSCLRFTLEESIWFQNGQEVGELYSLSLDPNVSIEELEQYVIIRGTLDLVGEYKGEPQNGHSEIKDYTQSFLPKTVQRVVPRENGLQEFMHRFPVDITIPYNRINSLEEVNVSIQTFDYLLPENNCLKLSADLLITGIYGEQQHSFSPEDEGNRADSEDVLQPEAFYIPDANDDDETAPMPDELLAGSRFEEAEDDSPDSTIAEDNVYQEALFRLEPVEEQVEEEPAEERLADVQYTQIYETGQYSEESLETEAVEERAEEQNLISGSIIAATNPENVRNEDGSNDAVWPAAQLQGAVEDSSNQDDKVEDGSDLFLPFEAVARKEPVQDETVESPQLEFSRGETTSQAGIHPAGEIQTKPGGQIEEDTTPFYNIPQETTAVSSPQQAGPQLMQEAPASEVQEEEQPVQEVKQAEPVAEEESPVMPMMQVPQVTYGQEKTAAPQSASQDDLAQEQQSNKKADYISLTDLFGHKGEELAKLKICIVQQGDSINTLADRYDVSVQAILNSNDLDPSQDVKEGQVLYIPQLAATGGNRSEKRPVQRR